MAQAVAGQPANRTKMLVFLMIGALVSLSLGVYGRVHDPTGDSLVSGFFTSSINLKVWFATVAFVLAIAQVLMAARFYGHLGHGRGPRWLGRAHRISGTLAFLFAIPVAYHCLWSLGYQSGQTRVLIHGTFGCLFFGALTAKVLIVRSPAMPKLALPVLGGLVFTALTVLWLTSAFWFFTTVQFPGV
jgi:uncharacterized protein DUF6529